MTTLKTFRVRHEGDAVLLSFNEAVFIETDWKAAGEIARALLAKAKLAEEYAHINQIIDGSAILMRAGAPFTLTNLAKALDAAKVEAEHSRELRRSNMGAIKSSEVLGLPTIIGRKKP